MIIKRADLEARLAKKSKASLPNALLLYGPNQGLARYYEQRILAAHLAEDPSVGKNIEGVVRTNLQALTKGGSKLSDLLCSPSLFGGKKIVLLEVMEGERFDAKKIFENCLEELAKNKGTEDKGAGSKDAGSLIVRTAILRKDAALRKIFTEKATSFACYEESGTDVIPMLREVLDREKILVENSLLQDMAEVLAIDRMAALQELEKIALYYGAGGKIDSEVWQLLSDWHSGQIGELLYDAFDGRSENCLSNLDKLKIGQVSGIVIIRSAMRHIQCLRNLRQASRGNSIKLRSAIASWRPFVLFHLRERLSGQVRHWDAASLLKLLGGGLSCEKLIKSRASLQWLLTERYILGISKSASKGVRN